MAPYTEKFIKTIRPLHNHPSTSISTEGELNKVADALSKESLKEYDKVTALVALNLPMV